MSAAQSALLVVDDNEDNRYTLTRRLKREGYENLTVAENGEQALDLLAARPFDLVLLDVMMPGLNGYEVLERMHADDGLRHIPVIMISALDEVDSVIRCIELGAEDYLSKPFNPTLLRARVGASLEKKRLRDELVRHTRRMEQELETAREIQLSMVPTAFPAPTTERPLEIFATLQPAREVGGDLYDFFWVTPERLCLVVADVSDKGAGAALFMARAKSVIRLLAQLLPDEAGRPATVAEVVYRANQELCRDNPHGMFVTLVLAMLDAATGEVEYCNAGHNRPCLIAPQAGVTELKSVRQIPVGIRENFRYEAATLKLAPGESLFVFTDGITEAMNPSGELFGEERLVASLRSHARNAPREVVSAVLRDVRDFAGAAAPSDDIGALACRWRGVSAVSITIVNAVSELARVSALADEFAAANHLSSEAAADLHVVLDEVLTNIIKYGYTDDRAHDINIELWLEDGVLVAQILDDGRPFDPLTSPEPDVTAPLQERRVGGMGIHFVRKLMHEVNYRRVADRNRLVLKRRLEA